MICHDWDNGQTFHGDHSYVFYQVPFLDLNNDAVVH